VGAGLIRGVEPRDLDDLHRICLLTGDSGQDASALYRDPRLIGEVFAAPYAVLEPGSGFVAEDHQGVAGYILGARNTPAFEARLETEWWPALRARYVAPTGDPASWGPDEARAWEIHNPHPTPARITGPYPSHLHIDLLPRLQGRGLGKALIDRWLERMRELKSPGVHLGVSRQNVRAIRFYRTYGFEEFRFPRQRPDAEGLYFVMKL
jgi:ribosomal protein S18 acetylase RimI-like enzyme